MEEKQSRAMSPTCDLLQLRCLLREYRNWGWNSIVLTPATHKVNLQTNLNRKVILRQSTVKYDGASTWEAEASDPEFEAS